MNTKNLTLIIALATVGTLGTINLNAAESALSPTAKGCHATCTPVTTANTNLIARKSEVVASPKVFANFPYLAGGHKIQPSKPMVACTCCKP
jgi:hypothetical protein